jgi:hypothetical protein
VGLVTLDFLVRVIRVRLGTQASQVLVVLVIQDSQVILVVSLEDLAILDILVR